MVTGSDDTSEWIGFVVHDGRVRESMNPHLPADQRQHAQQLVDEGARQRGQMVLTVIVEVYENGQAVPQVQLPPESPLNVEDTHRIATIVRGPARDALAAWR